MLDRTANPNPRPSRKRPPPGYEIYNINWDALSPMEIVVVIWFADALRAIREEELELLRLSVSLSDQERNQLMARALGSSC